MGVWILSAVFSMSIDTVIQFFIFNILIWWVMLIDIWMSYEPCIPTINLSYPWCVIYVLYWIWAANIFLRDFASKFMKHIVLQFCFSVLSLFIYLFVCFGQGNIGLLKWVEKCSFSLVFWDRLRKLVLIL